MAHAKISLNASLKGFGKNVLYSKRFHSYNKLKDINLRYINLLEKRLNKRIETLGLEENVDFFLTLSFEHIIKPGLTEVCSTRTSEIKLNWLDKLILNRALVFERVSKQNAEDVPAYQQILHDTQRTTVSHIKQDNYDLFKVFNNNLVDYIIAILETGERPDEAVNYSTIYASEAWGGSLHSFIFREYYYDVLEHSAKSIDKNVDYFKDCCFFNYKFTQISCNLLSLASSEATLQSHIFLGYKLSDWWRQEATLENRKYSINDLSLLAGVNGKNYISALEKYISSWEDILRVALKYKIPERKWDRPLFDLFENHLTGSYEMLTQSVLTGNELGIKKWSEHIFRWFNFINDQQHFEFFRDSYKIFATPDKLAISFDEVQTIAPEDPNLRAYTDNEEAAFLYFLKKLWIDYSSIALSFYIEWASNEIIENNEANAPILAIEKFLYLSFDPLEGDIYARQKPLESKPHFIESFLRQRYVYERPLSIKEKSYYGAFAERINRLNEPHRPSGRIFVTSGSAFDVIPQSQFILYLLLADGHRGLFEREFEAYIEYFSKQPKDYSNVLDKLGSDIHIINSLCDNNIARTRYLKLFKFLYKRKQGANVNPQETLPEEFYNELFFTSLQELLLLFQSLKEKVKAAQTAYFNELDISKIKKEAISQIYSNAIISADYFPLNLPNNTVSINNISDDSFISDIRYPIFSETILNIDYEENTHSSASSHQVQNFMERLKNTILYRICELSKARSSIESFEYSEEEFKQNLKATLDSLGDIPEHYILVDYNTPNNSVIRRWLRQRNLEPIAGINISFQGDADAGAYCYINNIPAINITAEEYENKIFLIPLQILESITFQDFGYNTPANIDFEKIEDQPTRGLLTVTCNFHIELNENYRIYEFHISPNS